MRIPELIQLLNDRGEPRAIVTNVRAQFGTAALPLMGATLLPERTVNTNIYRERSIIFRAPIATDIARYSPPPKEASAAVGDFLVELTSSGRKSDITAEDLDVLMDLLQQTMDFGAAQRITDFVTTGLLLPILQHNERQRWQAIVDARVDLVGENTLREPIDYPDPAGNRVTLGTLWDAVGSDAVVDYFAMIDHMRAKGVSVRRTIASTRMRNRFLSNPAVQSLVGGLVTVGAGGSLSVQAARVNDQRLNDYLGNQGLPPIETNDQLYRTVGGNGNPGVGRYLRDDAMVFIGATGALAQIDLPDGTQDVLPDTLGYYAIGRPAGRTVAGRHVLVRAFDDHPPRVEGEIVQEGLPVITQPDAIGVLSES